MNFAFLCPPYVIISMNREGFHDWRREDEWFLFSDTFINHSIWMVIHLE